MTTFTICKRVIEIGRYEKEDMLNKLDVFLLSDRLSQSEYEELVGIINAT